MTGSSGPAPRWASPGTHRVVTADVGEWTTAEGGSVAVLARYPAAAFADRVHGDLAAGDWLASGPLPAIFAHEHQELAA